MGFAPLAPLALTCPLGFALAGPPASGLDLVSHAAEVQGLPVDLLGRQAPVVHPGRAAGGGQGLVGRGGPGGPPALDQVGLVPVSGLLPEGPVFEGPEGQEDVGVGVPRIGVNGEVRDHPQGDTLPPHPPLDQVDLLLKGQLHREGQLEFPGELGVLSFLGGFHGVPKRLPLQDPGGGGLGREDGGVGDGGAASVVPGPVMTGVSQRHAGAVGGGGHDGLAGGPADDLDAETVEGHVVIWDGSRGLSPGTRHSEGIA